MNEDKFFRFGSAIYQARWLIIIIFIVILGVFSPVIPKIMDPFKSIGFTSPNTQSAKANEDLNNKLGYSYNRFIIIYKSNKLFATDPEFRNEVKRSLSGLKKIAIPHQIIYPDNTNQQISKKNKHIAYAVILFKGSQEVSQSLLEKFKNAIKSPTKLTMRMGGEPIFLDDTKKQTQKDLFMAEYIGTPAAIITMLLVFGSIVAAIIPIILGGFCALLILLTLFGIGHLISLSVFTINIALLLGLCLSLDYSLLIINRYRDELKLGRSNQKAIAITETTAGKTVFFSGLAVFVSLSALLLFPVNILFSVGVGGLTAVFIAVIIAVLLLPAILAILNKRINWLSIAFFKRRKPKIHSILYKFVRRIAIHPYFFFFTTFIFLLILGYPFLHARYGISDFRILPITAESRQVFEIFKDQFGENKLAPILVVIKTQGNSILTKKNIGYLYDFSDKLKENSNVKEISSIVNTDPRLSKKEYQMLYTTQKSHLTEALKKFLTITTHDNLTVMNVIGKSHNNSEKSYQFITQLRKTSPGNNMTLQVTGTPANTIDVKNSIAKLFPYALLWIMGFTYFVFLILYRSIIIPFKAIFMSILSLSASYGLLVLIIQDGYLHRLLNFEPQGMLDISLLIIIFCALFGVSMDYEVFLLSRIKEYYEKTGNNVKSVITGIDRSGKIISSAAIIVIIICFSFISADILLVKAFGLGIAIAVFVDAFIIRIILVPALMTLLNKFNWYAPKWLINILPKISFARVEKKREP